MSEMTTDRSEAKKNQTVIQIQSSSLKERFAIVIINLSVLDQKRIDLITMVAHFSKYGRTKQVNIKLHIQFFYL